MSLELHFLLRFRLSWLAFFDELAVLFYEAIVAVKLFRVGEELLPAAPPSAEKDFEAAMKDKDIAIRRNLASHHRANVR